MKNSKYLVALIIKVILLCVTVQAQDSSVFIKGILNTSKGEGYGMGLGAELQWHIQVPEKFTPKFKVVYVGNLQAANEPKKYVGDGRGARFSNKIRLYPANDIIFVEAGLQNGWYYTSEYFKGSKIFFAGAGANIAKTYIVSYNYLFPDRYEWDRGDGVFVSNNVRGHRFNADIILPISDDSKWQLINTYTYGRYKFEQPIGFSNAGTYNVNSLTIGFGVGRKLSK